MAKKKHVPKSDAIWHMSAEEATLAKMPKYNAHAYGSGVHGDTKYNRCRTKRAWERVIADETRSRGSHSLQASNLPELLLLPRFL